MNKNIAVFYKFIKTKDKCCITGNNDRLSSTFNSVSNGIIHIFTVRYPKCGYMKWTNVKLVSTEYFCNFRIFPCSRSTNPSPVNQITFIHMFKFQIGYYFLFMCTKYLKRFLTIRYKSRLYQSIIITKMIPMKVCQYKMIDVIMFNICLHNSAVDSQSNIE